MRYLITTKETYSPYLSDWFDAENDFNPDLDMVVFDLFENIFTTDGEKWYKIQTNYF